MSDQETGKPQEAQMSPTNADGNGFQPPSCTTSIPLPELKQSSTPKSAHVEPIDQASIHKSTGPRTPQGKKRSKYNALKHGLFSKAILLEGESRPEYESLLNGLRESLQPQGILEEVLVEKLATILWRERRLLQAEAAEIEKATILNMDRTLHKEADELEYAELKEAPDRKLTPSSNLTVFENAIEILDIVRQSEEDDSQIERVGKVFRMIYGCEKDGDTPYGFRQLCFAMWKLLSAPQEVENSTDTFDAMRFMRKAIDKEVHRLAKLHDLAASVETLKRRRDLLEARVPSPEVSARLLRHEAQLSREFARTLNELERLQRMRKGQPVLPPIKVEVSS